MTKRNQYFWGGFCFALAGALVLLFGFLTSDTPVPDSVSPLMIWGAFGVGILPLCALIGLIIRTLAEKRL